MSNRSSTREEGSVRGSATFVPVSGCKRGRAREFEIAKGKPMREMGGCGGGGGANIARVHIDEKEDSYGTHRPTLASASAVAAVAAALPRFHSGAWKGAGKKRHHRF